MKIKILNDIQNDYEDSGEEYGDWSAKITHNITGAIKVEEKEYFDLEVNDDFLNKEVYLLYILYETGDSFGASSGNIEYLDVFKNYDKALEVKKIIEYDYKRSPIYSFQPEGTGLFYRKENGNVAKIPTNIYKGYFEDLEAVVIQKILIKDKN
jgi:hypothetical protein